MPTAVARTATVIDDLAARRFRADFPLLDRRVNGHPLVYLDSAATSQKPRSVIETERRFYETSNAAVNRGSHKLAYEATEAFTEARRSVAAFFTAQPEEIVWTSNATEGLNLLAYSFSNASLGRGGDAAKRFALRPGDEIVVTEMEHHANLIPWQELAFRTGATLRFIPIGDDGTLLLDEAEAILGERTRILAVTHASNVLGTINPVAHLVAMARRVGALVVLDACQSAPHLPLDLPALGVDFAVLSGHKMLAPTGIGALYGRRELLDAMPPFLTGGSMISTVTMSETDYLPAPERFEAGTQPVSQAIAFASAVGYLGEVGMERIRAWDSQLGRRLVEGLSALDGVRVIGPGADQERIGLAAFDVDGVHAHDVGQFLDDRGIAVRVGHHCAQPLHRRLGLTATTRASTYLYTTTDEVDALIAAVSEVRGYFGVAG
ncbi:MAG: SufS family cysteine desulfurase [Actinomycetota bacterium]